MSTALSLSTDGMPARETVGAWHDWMAGLFYGLQSDVYGDTEFDGHLHSTRAGDVLMVRLEANRHRVTQMATRSAQHSDAPYLKIVAPWQGLASVEQHGRQARARPGAWAIYDTTGRYVVQNPERSQHLIVMVPKEQLAASGLRLQELMGRLVGGTAGISRVALEAMRSTYLELPSMSAQAARGAGDLITELVRLSLCDLAGQGTAATQAEAMRDRIRAHVGRHLHDASLSIEGIAQALNCSKRLLHKSFGEHEGEGEGTLAQYILQRRLEGCMRELRDATQATRSITEIAFSWGFNSSAHFSRAFRAHTGLSPSDYRRQGAAVN
ncbi:helix-turn-helix domain-containing protein [Xenophilus arseniciresistens]|uniref:Helix-turn-helix domain-containing protein n=1 Tax=Xenophilus arseniciresistens TaxID=1283306 RepID=A0AAE3NE83_9BURK|nr:helix-turn-helix domain-containing protein [Xenophilus arseniciresistens]MDA7418662.1 helix-turn-helix domain-containing protein [Xenophilus arseniciresistens]